MNDVDICCLCWPIRLCGKRKENTGVVMARVPTDSKEASKTQYVKQPRVVSNMQVQAIWHRMDICDTRILGVGA